MTEFKTRIQPNSTLYLPKEVRQSLGDEVVISANYYTAVIYPETASLKTVVRSLKTIIDSLNTRIEAEKN